jgi:phage tail-like protein
VLNVDANGARFQALWGHAGDWQKPVTATAAVEEANGALRLKSQTPTFGNVSALNLKPEARRGATRDRFGNWYWIDPTGRGVLVQSSGTGAIGPFWPPPIPERVGAFQPAPAVPAPQPGRLAGAAVTRNHVLVVGALDPPGLLAFDLTTGGPPRRVSAPQSVPFAPFDVAALGDGVVVLDRTNSAAWAFDRELVPRPITAPQPVHDPFQPFDPKSPRRTHDASPTAAVKLPAGWPAAIAVEGVSCDAAWVLHQADVDPAHPGVAAKGSPVARIDWSALPVASAPVLGTEEASRLAVQNLPVGGHDFTLVASDRLEVALADGTQALAFGVPTLTAAPDFIPLRKFGGLAYVGTAYGDDSGARPGYDSSGTWAAAAVMPRPQFAPTATVLLPDSNGWDGKTAGCVWHRVFLDACVPPGCSVRLKVEVCEDRTSWKQVTIPYPESGSADPSSPATPWQPDPIPRAEGSELPFAPALPTGFGTWETLLHNAQGRYLRLTLVLTGNLTRTPRVRAVRAWYPRFSYLEHYLPAIYRNDPTSASFLDRFLANTEGTLTGIEDRIVAVRALVDPRTVPADALDWLLGWLGLAAPLVWDATRQESIKRTLLRYAPVILRQRGTVRGLQWALHLALDACTDESIFADLNTDTSPYRIVEAFRRRTTPAAVLGDPTSLDLPRQADPTAITTARWRPGDGTGPLNSWYAAAQGQTGKYLPFPLCPPTDPNQATTWGTFAQQVLGFVPAARPGDPDDEARWAAFLRRRYRTDPPLGVPLPLTLDVRASVAADWYLFETVVMAAVASAHQFEVLIPVVSGGRAVAVPTPADLDTSLQRRDLARQVVQREAPAHCRFDVRLYAAAFRVGGARVGDDTLLGSGTASPDLYDKVILAGAYLGEAFLADRPPRDASGLTVLGQTPVFRASNPNGASSR